MAHWPIILENLLILNTAMKERRLARIKRRYKVEETSLNKKIGWQGSDAS